MFDIMFIIFIVFICLWPKNILFRWMLMRLLSLSI